MTFVYIYINIYIERDVFVSVCVCLSVCVCMYVCVFINIYRIPRSMNMYISVSVEVTELVTRGICNEVSSQWVSYTSNHVTNFPMLSKY